MEIQKINTTNEFCGVIYSNALKNWNVKQGVSERSVHEVREYANTPKFCGANSSKHLSIPPLLIGVAARPCNGRSNPFLITFFASSPL
ncbi:MAG: hypothetical protein LN561_04615 [Rickettsia endosymbiont of Labidopullus appendiculatus]|nr:hypothetical protein [Rickettsia endosymbiont of Labidopullus appendiculatus]